MQPPYRALGLPLLLLVVASAGTTQLSKSTSPTTMAPAASRYKVEDYHQLAEEMLSGSPKVVISSRHLVESMREDHAAFYAAFDDNEVGAAGGTVSNATQMHLPRVNEKRELLKVPISTAPRFDPSPGRYWTAVGVALIADPGDSIIYTVVSANDTLNPNGTTRTVPSGTIVHIPRTATITAYTLSHNMSSKANSRTVTGTWRVPYRQFGTAYLAPYHNAAPAYSGKLARVQLRTDLLSAVRIHNVLTDFADYYSFRGQAPHKKGMLHINDLSNIDPELVGFQGAFSGSCGGTAYGFLAPFFDGNTYSGKAVRIMDGHFTNVSSGTQCTTVKGVKNCAVTVLDLTSIDSSLAGFAGGFVSKCYAFFVPYFNGIQFASKVVRVHVANFTLANVTTLDLRLKDSQLAGFFGGFAHDGYGYLAPFRNVFGPVGKSNTRFTCDGFKNVDMTQTQATDGGDHMSPAMFGKFVRFRLFDNFTSSAVEVLDLTTYDPDLRGFSGAFAVGNQGILVPYRNREKAANQGFFSKVVKVDLTDFKTVEIMDLSHINQDLRGFMGGFAYGKYGLLVPHSNGHVTTNWQGRAEFGTVVRIDVNDFRIETVKTVDLPTIKRQQVPSFPVAHLRGYVQGFASGRHAFFVPYFSGVRSGLLTRIDMADFDRLADLQAAGNDTGVYTHHDGVQIVDLSLHDKGLVGFSGGAVIPEPAWA